MRETIRRMTTHGRWYPVCAVAIAVSAAMVYWPILRTYGYTDAYEFLYSVGNANFTDVFIQGGRPLYGWLNKLLFASAGDVDGLRWIRFLGLTGMVVCALQWWLILDRSLSDRGLALAGALLLLATPTAGVVAGWSATYQVGWAMALALYSGDRWRHYTLVHQHRMQWWPFLLLLMLNVGILMLYQPAFTAFLLPVFTWLLLAGGWRMVYWHLVMYAASFAVYYVLHQCCLLVTDLPPLARAGLLHDPWHKLHWFVETVLPMVMRDAFFLQAGVLQRNVQIICFALFGLSIAVAAHDRKRLRFVVRLLLIVLIVFMAYLPNLASSDDWVSYRTLGALFMLKEAVLLRACSIGFGRLRWAGRWLAVVLAAGMLIMAHGNIRRGQVDLQCAEWEAMLRYAASESDRWPECERLCVRLPPMDYWQRSGRVLAIGSDEFGSPSLARPWVPLPMFNLAYRQVSRDLDATVRVEVAPCNVLPPHLPDPRFCRLDWSAVQRSFDSVDAAVVGDTAR